MIIDPPPPFALEELIGRSNYEKWISITELVNKLYNVSLQWHDGGKRWTYDLKFKTGQKTLCSLLAKEGASGFMIILGQKERKEFEDQLPQYSTEIKNIYESTHTYHDGKWLLFYLDMEDILLSVPRLLSIKKKSKLPL